MDLKLIININKMTTFKYPLTFKTIDLIKSFKLNVNCFFYDLIHIEDFKND